MQGGFPVAVALLALDERVADPDDAVAVLEFELGGAGCAGNQRNGGQAAERNTAKLREGGIQLQGTTGIMQADEVAATAG